MKFSTSKVIVLTLVVLAIAGPSWASVIPQPPEHTVMRRSLCNTFGACSSKRSMLVSKQQYNNNGGQQRAGQYESPDGILADGNVAQPWSAGGGRESRAERVNEILGDLLEYLKGSDKYRQGKYVIMVPKPGDNMRPSMGADSQMDAMELDDIPQQPQPHQGRISYPHRRYE